MNRLKISLFGTMLCLLGLGFSDTAKGQTLSASPSSMSFAVQSGGGVGTQSLTITPSNGATTLYVNLQGAPTWLTVNNQPSGSSFYVNTTNTVVLTVAVNTGGLNTGQTYSGNFQISINGLQSSTINYAVTLAVGTPSLLSANPSSLTFSAIQGASAGTPNPALVSITSSAQVLNYTVSATTATGVNWLLLSGTTGTSGGSAIQVYVNASQLASGNYTGSILVQSTTTGDSVTIPVTLSVTTGASLNVTGTLQNFVYQAGTGLSNISSQSQTLMVSTTSGQLNYSVSTTSTNQVGGTTWLVVTPNGGTATTSPQTLTLTLSPQYVEALPAGTYTISLSVVPTGAANTGNNTVVTVTLIVTNNPLLNTNTKSLTFSVPFGTTTSQSQTVTVTSSGSSIPYILTSNVAWLSATPASGTTGTNPTFNVYVNASGLAVSSTPYTGILYVQPNNSDYGLYNIPITVTLTVTSATTTVYAGPSALLFSYQTTQSAPPAQLVQLTSSGVVGFAVTATTMAASNCGTGGWLTATPSQLVTPASLSISISVTGMTPGTCSGSVIVTYNNGQNANTTVIIPVTVDISATSLLTITQPYGFGVVTASYGSTTAISNQISINSTDGSALPFTATASTPSAPVSWLYLGASSGTTQQYLQVQILPSGLPVGTYSGSITIYSANGANLPSGSFTIPVTLTVSASTTVSYTPTSLAFTVAQGATTAPATQAVTLTATGGTTTFTASPTTATGGNWLTVTPASGTASGTASTLNVGIATPNSLSPGTYTGTITIVYLNSASPTASIPVTLTVTTAQTITASASSLSFTYQLGSAAPAAQTVNVTSTGGAASVTVAATTTSGPTGWLSVTPTSGSTGASGTPLALSVSVSASSFTTAGSYAGTITITQKGGTSITIPVSITVAGVPVPAPATISNSASGAFGVIAPGELITIKGSGLGPATAATFTLATPTTVSNTLSGVQVLFDGIAGTPTYVSATQINVIVPYEIAGRTTTNVVVSYGGQLSSGISQSVAAQAPGIYTFSSTGAGQASVLNQNGTYNGPSAGLVINGQSIPTTPAAAGSVIAVYMTGGGQTNPASSDGTVTPGGTTLYKIPGTVTATINGVNAPVQFAGAAPGLVTGVIQVNILVPSGVSGNGQSLVITINGTASAIGPTVAIQ